MSAETDLHFDQFPTELLRLIFDLCDTESLIKLCQTCRRFNEILSEDLLWKRSSNIAIITNLLSSQVRERCLFVDKMRERCRQAHNWRIGKYSETIYRFYHVKQKTRFMPWLWLTSAKLWISKGDVIEGYIRHKHGRLSSRPLVRLRASNKEDFSRFTIKRGLLVCGGRNGGLYGWENSTSELLFSIPASHQADVYDVDIHQNLVLSSSRDRTVKIWQMNEQGASIVDTVSIGDRVLCVAAESDLWCCGSSGIRLQDTLHVFDCNSGELVTRLGQNKTRRPGAGLLDVVWETSQLIFSCGYDATLKLWDLRVPGCVGNWDDPHDTALYCLASDGSNSIFCGSSRHSRVHLWDKRQSKGVQMYFASSPHSSPVYSLTFDAGSLYIALDQSLSCLDFTIGRDATIRNFSLHA